MFINIIEGADECRCFSNTAAMNTYLMLYAKSIKNETYRGVFLSAGQTVASKQYIAKVFKCSIDKAKGYLKTLLRNGLIQLEYNDKIKQNIVTIPAVNPSPGTNYVQMQIPEGVKIERIYKNRCKFLTNIYMYLTLHASHKDEISLLANTNAHRGELIGTLGEIAAFCGCCIETVRNVLNKLKELKLVVFDAFQSVATRVKLLFYPALKEAAKKVTKAIETFVRKDTKNDNVTNSKNVAAPSVSNNNSISTNEDIVETPVTEDVKYLLFTKKNNKNISRLNNIITEVDLAVKEMKFPLEQLRTALETLYEKNKKNNKNGEINASMIITFLREYKNEMLQADYAAREKAEKEHKFLEEKATKEKDLKTLDDSWQLVKDAAVEVKKQGQLTSFSEAEISTMYYLLNNIGVARHTLLERGQILAFAKDDLIEQDRKSRKQGWSEDTIAQAILLERLLAKSEITEAEIEDSHLKDKKLKTESLNRFIADYKASSWANSVAQK
jgi:hypothetical protein